MAKEVEIPFLRAEGYAVPLLKVKIRCPKLGEESTLYALPDTGSRFSLINRKTLLECFDDPEGFYFDTVMLLPFNIYAKRYRVKLHLIELNEEVEIPLVAVDFNPPEGIFPSIILGRDDFFSRATVCFEDNSKLVVRLNSPNHVRGLV